MTKPSLQDLAKVSKRSKKSRQVALTNLSRKDYLYLEDKLNHNGQALVLKLDLDEQSRFKMDDGSVSEPYGKVFQVYIDGSNQHLGQIEDKGAFWLAVKLGAKKAVSFYRANTRSAALSWVTTGLNRF